MLLPKTPLHFTIFTTITLILFSFSTADASQQIGRKIKSHSTSDSASQLGNEASSADKSLLDPRMADAVKIAESNARSRSLRLCWRYVKRALLAADLVESYPGTTYAKSAGTELSENFGFKKLPVSDPFDAPVGSVLVYGGRGAGHVELRSDDGFVSDFVSVTPSPRPLIGVYFKPADMRNQG